VLLQSLIDDRAEVLTHLRTPTGDLRELIACPTEDIGSPLAQARIDTLEDPFAHRVQHILQVEP